jgi:hypothetical protein
METESICLIEEWLSEDPFNKVKTLSPVFTDMGYAINQVEDLVFSQLLELKENEQMSDREFAEAVGSIPFKWSTQPAEADDAQIYMHNQPQLENVYTVSQLPVVDNKLADIKIQ